MYSFIEGKVVEKNPAFVVIENQGIGYYLNISVNTFEQIKSKDIVKLFTHFAIRNEATTPVGFNLFGFASEEERQFFKELISVSGVGNSTAMLILSKLSPGQLFEAIEQNNIGLLQSVKGIGSKSAQRIMIDLKDKLIKGKITTEILVSGHNTNVVEALSGLAVLGFKKNMAEKALKKVMQKNQNEVLPTEVLIKEALKIL